MNARLLLIAGLAFGATLLGGFFALRFRDRLHLILGFSAGAVVAVALFDLLPAAMSVSTYSPGSIAIFIAAGFFAYLMLDRFILIHPHGHMHAIQETPEPIHGAPSRGIAGAVTLAAHSFFDGAAIGFGFQVSPAIGLIVAAAVITHDFSDGINTVGFLLRDGGGWRRALPWLLLDALAPVVGIGATVLLHLSPQTLGFLLGVFAGTFLYLGASDLIPESHHHHPRAATTLMTLLGAATIFLAVQVWGG